MSSKITSDHLGRGAAIYVRQSTMGQVMENTESQRRQYELVESARAAGFTSISVIDDDLGRSGSGLMERPGFQKLVASVCTGSIGAVYCIEASRLARNGRDWHHLIELCALVGTLVIDPDGIYDPRLVNDRLLLGSPRRPRRGATKWIAGEVAMKIRMIAILMTTTRLLTRADSRMPTTSNAEITTIMTMAGTLSTAPVVCQVPLVGS